MKTTPLKNVALAASLLGLGTVLVAQSANNPPSSTQQFKQQANRPSANPTEQPGIQRPDRMQSLRQANEDPRGRSVSDLIGWNVTDKQGQKLGEVNDFVLDAPSGKVVYAFVSSGRGFGARQVLRAVPFSALKHDAASAAGERVTLDIDQAKWAQAPVFLKTQLPSLGQDQRGRDVFQFYGQRAQQSGQLVLTSEIIGREIRSGTEEIGEVDDVIVQIQSGTAAALIDPNDKFAGTDQNYLVPLNRLQKGEDAFTTTLTRRDFSSATVAADESWARTPGGTTLYVWPSYASIQSSGSDRVTQSGALPPVEAITQALQADPSSAGSQGVISVVASGDRVILGGTVKSEDLKERIEDRAEQAAQGWNIENQIRVAQEGE